MVEMNNFKEKLQEYVQEHMNNVEVRFHKVQKNNGVVLDSVTIHSGKVNISPTIYLNQFLREMENGKEMETVFQEILRIYESNAIGDSMEMDFFMDWNKVKDNIGMRVINRSLNKDYILTESPFFNYLDLAVVFFYNVPVMEGATIRITNAHMEMWNISKDELLAQAKANLENDTFDIRSIVEVMGEMLGEMPVDFAPDEMDSLLYVLTSKDNSFGSKVLLHDESLARMSEIFGGKSYYVLPSSIWEVLAACPTSSNEPDVETVKQLKSMVCQVNDTEVQATEVLSNSVYFYNSEEKMLIIAG